MIQEQESQGFNQFGLKEPLLRAIKDAGFDTPSPIQEKVIPIILTGKDLVAQAQTGTGKTAAFGLPVMQLMNAAKGFELLVIAPTRELAMQVCEEFHRLGKHLGIKAVTLCGGKSSTAAIDQLRRGAQVVVATPGRLLDLLESRRLPNVQPSFVVLDEADEMLNMGFLEDIQKILAFLPATRQTLLFSATMPSAIQQLAKRFLNQPLFVSVTPKETSNQDIQQLYYLIQEHEREDALIRLLDSHAPTKSIVFCRTRKDVDRLSRALAQGERLVKGLHGDMEQPQREEVMRNFRVGKIDCLVATDIAARGLNVVDISHVYNYHMPFDSESYVHRIGRTARAGRKGVAVSLITPQELRSFQKVERAIGAKIEHRAIPSQQAVKAMRLTTLLQEIEGREVTFEATELVGQIPSEDLPLFAAKLVSLLIDRDQVKGPQEIGVTLKVAEKLLQESSTSSNTGSKKRFRERKSFHKRPHSFNARRK